MPDRPNLVLFLVDQWRGDCLSIAGHRTVQTPYLDHLAARGVRFTRCYSATPTCIPARAALYTGLTQHSHGRVGYRDLVPWDYPVTVASELGRHGYQTEAVGKLHVFPERSQMGFQHVVLHDGYLHAARDRSRNLDLIDDYLPWLRRELGRDADYFDHGVHCNSYVARPWDKPEHVHPSTWVVTMGIDFLRRRDPRKPFFLMLSFHRPHPPYDPPGWAFEQYLDREMPPPPVGDWADVYAPQRQLGPDTFAGPIDPVLMRRARAGYYGHMTHIDQQINRFVEVCQEYGVLEETVFAFTADHGEMMGDHHLFRKGFPYEGSAHVPLIISSPGSGRIPTGHTSDALVELRDLMPTFLDLADAPIPPQVEGESLVPALLGGPRRVRDHLHGEHTLFGQSLQWVTDGRRKYVWMSADGREQLFDLDEDPDELHDLANERDHEPDVRELRACLAESLIGREEGFVRDSRLVPGRPVTPVLLGSGLQAPAQAALSLTPSAAHGRRA